jgi:ketosteroid isomerase-like protein
MEVGVDAMELHRQVEAAFNGGDVDALMALYVDDAQMVRDDGSVACGLDAIREIWAGFVALRGRITMRTRFAVEQGDIALLSNAWEFEGAGLTLSATTAEVARRGSDGTWRYAIDNPFGLTTDTA